MKVSCALILLAGGLGSRLGADKALQPVAGKPMITRIIERIGAADEWLVVIARNALPVKYSQVLPRDVRVINDELDGKSPLIGMITGLRFAKSQYAVLLSCDIPFVSRHVIQLLMERVTKADAAIPRWKSGQQEPLQAAYRREITLLEAEKSLAAGEFSPVSVVGRLPRVMYVSVEDEIDRIDPGLRTFFNVNTRQDLALAETLLSES